MTKYIPFIFGVVIITSFAFSIALYNIDKSDKQNQEIKLLEQRIEAKQKIIDSLNLSISFRTDTIRIIEQRQNIYTTKTINNEKVILLSSDSINDVMYQNNKRKFFNEWMQGRYTPAKYK